MTPKEIVRWLVTGLVVAAVTVVAGLLAGAIWTSGEPTNIALSGSAMLAAIYFIGVGLAVGTITDWWGRRR